MAAILISGLILAAACGAAILSLNEGQKRAAGWSLGLGLAAAVPFLVIGLFLRPNAGWTAGLLGFYLAAAIVLALPIDPRRRNIGAEPRGRFDERETMFSRRELIPGTARYREFYGRHPEKLAADEAFRSKPGLLSEKAAHYDRAGFAAAEASFAAVKALHPLVEDSAVRPVKPASDPDASANTRFIKAWAAKLGAFSAGVAGLKDYHFYTHGGRGERYGQEVIPRHTYGVAVTVEMDPEMIDAAPFAPVIMESARQYLRSGAVAVQLAETIRRLGYSARAHIDGNYEVVCPLLARDAGLGEVGRMGLLMTPAAGPRVRVAVVTTDWPLVADRPTRDGTVVDFCRICRKCADHCPARAIPWGDREDVEGPLRWRVDAQACFSYWCAIGTDCGLCVRVCPYSRRDNFFHRAVRAGVKRSFLFRRLAVLLDDVFYGKPIIQKKGDGEWKSG